MSEKSELKTYIRLYRSIEKWGWYTDSNTKSLFLHCLIKANYRDKIFLGNTVVAGSFMTSLNHLSLETGLTIQQIRTCIKKLIKTNEIVVKSTSNFTQIFVVKWGDYQCQEEDSNKPSTNEQQTSNKPSTTTNKDKKDNKDNNKINIGVFETYSNDNLELLNALKDFEQMRNHIKAPMTDRARKMICTQLDKLKEQNQNIIECINKSVVNNWKDIYAIQEKVNYSKPIRNEPIPDYNVSKSEMSKDELDDLKVRLKELSKKV